eukprot:5951418-Pyramimonas_sp.AAC.3
MMPSDDYCRHMQTKLYTLQGRWHALRVFVSVAVRAQTAHVGADKRRAQMRKLRTWEVNSDQMRDSLRDIKDTVTTLCHCNTAWQPVPCAGLSFFLRGCVTPCEGNKTQKGRANIPVAGANRRRGENIPVWRA